MWGSIFDVASTMNGLGRFKGPSVNNSNPIRQPHRYGDLCRVDLRSVSKGKQEP